MSSYSHAFKVVPLVLALLLAACDSHKATPAASSVASAPTQATTVAVPLTKEQWLSRIESTAAAC